MTALELFGTWRLAEPVWLHLAWGALVAPVLVVLAARWRAARLRRFADESVLEGLAGRSRGWVTACRAAVAGLVCLLLGVGLARPQSDPVEVETERTGRNVIFLLDVSRSMLATDVAPDRLGRAKLWIDDLVSELRGDRFGLVVFAGNSSVLSPLTADRAYFRMVLDEASPESVTRGGTNLGDAIRRTTELLIPPAPEGGSERVLYDLVLVTDGEDQESLPVEAARAAAQRGVRIIALGIGSERGAAIPEREGSSQTVRTRLESGTLEAVARATPGGVFLEVGTGTVDLARLYRDLISGADQERMESASAVRYTERFGWFLWPVLVLLLAERVLVPLSPRRRVW